VVDVVPFIVSLGFVVDEGEFVIGVPLGAMVVEGCVAAGGVSVVAGAVCAYARPITLTRAAAATPVDRDLMFNMWISFG
jgi:exosortase/archaeosortase